MRNYSRFLFLFIVFSWLLSFEVKSQCANNNSFLADLTPAYCGDTVFNACVTGGDYITTQVTVGYRYVFSTCGINGFNTQLTLRNSTGTVWYAFNDNFCGQQSQITWIATFTGSVRVLVDESPSCGSNSTCQPMFVTQQCLADVGTFNLFKNGNPTTDPIYLCEGQDTVSITSNNDFVLPAADSGEIAELMYMAFDCPPTPGVYPPSDSCFTGIYLSSKDITDQNPGLLATGQKYYITPITVDDGDNGVNPNSSINVDATGDSCYAIGTPIEVIYLSPLAFASNIDCANKSLIVQIFGGKSEYDTSNYIINNTGNGTIQGLPVTHGGSISITGLENGDMYSFTVQDNNGCQAVFSGGPFSSPNAGNDTIYHFCENNPTINLDTMIAGNHDTAGFWLNPSNIISTSLFTPGTSLEGEWKYVINGYGVCDNDTSKMEIVIDSILDAGSNSVGFICEFDTNINMWSRLTTQDTNGAWEDNLGNSFNGVISQFAFFSSTRVYYYFVNRDNACATDSSRHVLNTRVFPKSGISDTVQFCELDSSQNLFDFLGGPKNSNGTWLDSNNNIFSGIFNPSSDDPGIYTYEVVGDTPCPVVTSFIDVRVSIAGNPGKDSVLTYCRNEYDSVKSLTSFLGGTPDLTGIWISPVGDTLADDSINIRSDIDGIYTYFVTPEKPCQDTTSSVDITLVEPPSSGQGDSIFSCDLDNQINMFNSLQGSPDTGGVWLDPGLLVATEVFVPGISQPGNYYYVTAGNAPCFNDTSIVFTSTSASSNPGRDSSITFCSVNDPKNLLDFIGGTPDTNGFWLDPFSNIFTGLFDPGANITGNYTYKINGDMLCPDTSSVLTVQVNQIGNAGTDSTLLLCSSDSALNLFTALGTFADSGGTWRDSSGNLFSGTFYPASTNPGSYKYIVSGISPCPDTSATVDVIVFNALNPGVSANSQFCSNGGSVPLLNQLSGSPDSIGTWKNPSGISHSGILNPSTDSSGIYQYTVAGIGSCKDTSSFLSIIIDKAPNPGVGDSLKYCTSDPIVTLFSLLTSNPDSNGIMYNTFGQPQGLFNPSSDPSGTYTYTVSGTGVCSDSSSSIIIGKESFVTAGVNANMLICESDSAINLFSVLNGTPDSGGVWNRLNGPAVSSIFDPAIDSSGIFEYTVNGISPCPDSTALVNMTVVRNVNAGGDTSVSFCSNMTPLNLLTLIPGSPDIGGSWLSPTLNSFNGILNPNSDTSGIYSYTVQGTSPCTDRTSLMNVTVNKLYDPGQSVSLTICENEPPFNFFNKLDGNPDIYGEWRTPEDSVFDGLSNSIDLTSGIYKYVIPSFPPCPELQSQVDLEVKSLPNAGTGGIVGYCETDIPVALIDLLSDNPQTNGRWFDPFNKLFGGNFNPSSDSAGVYSYVATGEDPCPDDTTTIEINVEALPYAGLNKSLDVCYNAENLVLTEILENGGDKGGYWINPSGSVFNGLYNGGSQDTGVYTYIVTGMNYCPPDSATAIITETESFNIYAGTDVRLVSGESRPLKASSFEAIEYRWEPREGLSDPLAPNPFVNADVTTEYVVYGTDRFGCEASDTLMVYVLPQIFIPNAFTPNKDGINDEWVIEGLEEYGGATVYVFNNDRVEVWKSNGPYDRWNGTRGGKFVAEGNYYYLIEFEDQTRFDNIKGVVSVLR